MENKEIGKIKPLYGELIGYLSQAPTLKEAGYLRDSSLWEQIHTCIDQLNNLTGQDYSRFKMTIKPSDLGGYVENMEYRSKLNGLIMNLHAQYFSDESAPFSGGPTTIFQQSQQQTAQNQIILITEFQTLIDKRLYGSEDIEPKEKTFLEKLKSVLPAIKTAAELVLQVITIAKSLGLDMGQVAHAFGL